MKKKNILVIEDDPDISKAVAFALKRHGYDVHLASDGDTGLKTVFKLIPDLVILDLMLPGLSGEEICKGVRESGLDGVEKIPIMMLTAKTMLSDRIVGKVIGANVYMTKPFAMEELIREVEGLLAATHGQS